jgi:hypothetical protein
MHQVAPLPAGIVNLAARSCPKGLAPPLTLGPAPGIQAAQC